MAYSQEEKQRIIQTVQQHLKSGKPKMEAIRLAGISDKTFYSWEYRDRQRAKIKVHTVPRSEKKYSKRRLQESAPQPTLLFVNPSQEILSRFGV